MELVDENEGYYDEEVVDFLDGETLPEFSLSAQTVPPQNSTSVRARLYDDTESEIGLLHLPQNVKSEGKGAEIIAGSNSVIDNPSSAAPAFAKG